MPIPPIPPLRKNARAFADACIETNSSAELIDALIDGPDETDCSEWEITPAEWCAAISTALSERKEILS